MPRLTPLVHVRIDGKCHAAIVVGLINDVPLLQVLRCVDAYGRWVTLSETQRGGDWHAPEGCGE